jgi:hypothetical protein
MGRRSVARIAGNQAALRLSKLTTIRLVKNYPFPIRAARRITLEFRIPHRRFSMPLCREMIGEIFSHEIIVRVMLPYPCRSCCSGRSLRWGSRDLGTSIRRPGLVRVSGHFVRRPARRGGSMGEQNQGKK